MRNARYRPQLAQVKPGNEAKPRVRKAFPDTAFWAPNVHTDATGHAHVTLTFPDSLTTWRATVHAITADSKAGSAISRVLVRKNVLVRMGTPRFMLKGDEITLPVIVHNYLDTAETGKGFAEGGGPGYGQRLAAERHDRQQGRSDRAVAAARIAGGHGEADRHRPSPTPNPMRWN